MSACAHIQEIVGVNDRHGDVLLRCTQPACHQRRRVKASALRRGDVTAESLAAWRPYLKVAER